MISGLAEKLVGPAKNVCTTTAITCQWSPFLIRSVCNMPKVKLMHGSNQTGHKSKQQYLTLMRRTQLHFGPMHFALITHTPEILQSRSPGWTNTTYPC
jgi:hypothetical protein